jgi:hypothetical protein
MGIVSRTIENIHDKININMSNFDVFLQANKICLLAQNEQHQQQNNKETHPPK